MSKKKKMVIDFKAYSLVQAAIQEGIETGWKQAIKYERDPDKEIIIEHLNLHIMDSLEKIMRFDNNT